jgi:hypothetical protein
MVGVFDVTTSAVVPPFVSRRSGCDALTTLRFNVVPVSVIAPAHDGRIDVPSLSQVITRETGTAFIKLILPGCEAVTVQENEVPDPIGSE